MSVRTLPEIRPARLPYLDRSSELNWLRKHRHEYLGQWVFLFGDQLIAHGTDPIILQAQARAKGIERPLIIHVVESPDMGGWD